MTKKKTEEKKTEKPEEPKKEFAMQYCKYEFDENEIRDMAAEMAQNIARAESVDAELKTIKAQFKADLETLTRGIQATAEKMNSGYEMRNIKCEVVRDYRLGMVFYKRTDNGEIAKERKMRDDERQVKIGE